jgi:hypothetical protein
LRSCFLFRCLWVIDSVPAETDERVTVGVLILAGSFGKRDD